MVSTNWKWLFFPSYIVHVLVLHVYIMFLERGRLYGLFMYSVVFVHSFKIV